MVIYRGKLFINSLLAVMIVCSIINFTAIFLTGSPIAIIPLSIQLGVIFYTLRRHERIINIIRLWALLPIIAGVSHWLYLLSGLLLEVLTDNHRFEETSIVMATINYTIVLLVGMYFFINAKKDIIPLRIIADDIEEIIRSGEIDEASHNKYFSKEISGMEKIKENIVQYADRKKVSGNSELDEEEKTKRMKKIVYMLRRNKLDLASKVEL